MRHSGRYIARVLHDESIILPDVSRVLACLYETNIRFRTIKMKNYTPMFSLQEWAPYRRFEVVSFFDGHADLEDSRKICRYIAEKRVFVPDPPSFYNDKDVSNPPSPPSPPAVFGRPFLLGKDGRQRASIEECLHYEEHDFNPPSEALLDHLTFPLDDDNDLDMQRRKLEEVLDVYEQMLGDSKYLAGDEFTLADLVHLPNCHHIAESGRFRYLLESRRNVWRWWSTISSRDSWQRVVRYMKTVEDEHKLEWLLELRRKRRGPVVRQVRKDPRKHIIAKSETV